MVLTEIQLGCEILLRNQLERGVRADPGKHQFVEHCYLQIMGLHNVVGAATQNNGIQHQTVFLVKNV